MEDHSAIVLSPLADYTIGGPIKTVGPYKDRFLPLRERSELPQLLLYFSSVFFSLKDNIHGHLPMKIFFS
jgi:hypothetical protein